MLHPDALLQGNLVCQLDEAFVVRLAHVGEAFAETVVVRTNQRVGHGMDMVIDDHDVTHVEGRVESACGIAEDEELDAQLHHHADGEGDFAHRVTFIIVETALHGNDFAPRNGAKKQLSLVSFHR